MPHHTPASAPEVTTLRHFINQFGYLGDRRAQLGQVVRRLAVETVTHRHAEFVRDSTCHT